MNKKKLLITLLIIFIIGLIAVIIYLNNRVIDDNSGFTLKENLKTEVYTKTNVKNYLETIEGKIISEDNIDNEKLGKQTVSFIYLNKDNKKRRGTIEIEIVDTEKPLVWLRNYQIKKGREIDLEKTIICVDNYDNNPTCEIEGTYDINTPGTYQLTYKAEDNSGNTYQKDFTLTVYEPVENTTPNTNQTQAEPKYTDFQEVLNNYKDENNEIGIDVSKWQGSIDFEKVKNAGATFVMIRVGSQKGTNGEYVLDEYFKQNIENALENDLKVGVYFYSYADSEKEAKEQAKWVMKQIKDYEINLPIVFDFESFEAFNQMELSIFGLNQIAETFIDTVENEGYEGVLYGSKNYLNAIWKYHTKSVWLAHYTNETDYDGDYFMWQLCDDGKIDGIDGYVDIDILYKK